MHASAAAAASSASSSADRDSPMAQARCPSPAGSVASCSASVSVAAPSPVVPSLSRLIFDGELEAAAKSERVLSVHGCVKEVQTIRRRQVEALFKCENEECALIIMWPLKSPQEPPCDECKATMNRMEEEEHVPTEDTTVLTQLVVLTTPHYSMNPKAQEEMHKAAQAREMQDTGASPMMAASSPGGASVASSSSSVMAASSSGLSLEVQASMPPPHIIEAQLMGAQCGQFDVGDEVEVQGRLCTRPLPHNKRLMLFIRADKIRARSLVDRPVSSKISDELTKNPLLLPMLISGFAPAVLGNKVSKLGCLLSLVSPEATVSPDDPTLEARRVLHAILVGRDEDVVPMLKACAMASPNGFIESLTARNSAPQPASRFLVEPPHCTEAAWNKAIKAAFEKLSCKEQDVGQLAEGATIPDLTQAAIGVRGTGTVEYADTQLGLHKRGILAFHANSSLKSGSSSHWLNAFNKYPELHTLMRKGLIYHVSGLCAVQRVVHTPTAIIMGGSARKEMPYDDSQTFKGNVGLPSNLFDEFDLQLRLDNKLTEELQSSYVEQCTSPSPLMTPRSSSASHASPAPSASSASLLNRNLRMQLHLPDGVEALPPSVLALYVRACLQKAEPLPLLESEKNALVEQFLTLKRQGAPLLPYSWMTMLRTVRSMARLRMSEKITPRHVQDAFEFLIHTRSDFQTAEQTVHFQGTGVGAAGKGRMLAAMRQQFLNAMYAHCQRENCWVHSVSACWDAAVTCGINRMVGPENFAQSFLQPMMDKQLILQGAEGKFKFHRNLSV